MNTKIDPFLDLDLDDLDRTTGGRVVSGGGGGGGGSPFTANYPKIGNFTNNKVNNCNSIASVRTGQARTPSLGTPWLLSGGGSVIGPTFPCINIQHG